jgi:hypothetical protein
VRFDNNNYPVAAGAVGGPAGIRAGACPRAGLRPDPGADRIELRQDGRIVGEHPRCFGRHQTLFNPRPTSS